MRLVKEHPFQSLARDNSPLSDVVTHMPKRVVAFVRREIGRKNIALAVNRKTFQIVTKEF